MIGHVTQLHDALVVVALKEKAASTQVEASSKTVDDTLFMRSFMTLPILVLWMKLQRRPMQL